MFPSWGSHVERCTISKVFFHSSSKVPRIQAPFQVLQNRAEHAGIGNSTDLPVLEEIQGTLRPIIELLW
jgi:hypothetical protein